MRLLAAARLVASGRSRNARSALRRASKSSGEAGLVASTRGAQGGYALIKPPSKVTLGHVIRILDGPLAPIGCVSKTAYQKCLDCPYATKAHCPLQHVMGGVRNAIADILDNYSLEDFISGMHGPRRSPVHRATARRQSEN